MCKGNVQGTITLLLYTFMIMCSKGLVNAPGNPTTLIVQKTLEM